MKISVSAFFPAYNDQHTIESLVRTVASELRKHTDDLEVIVVDDGSQDQTAEILDRLATEMADLRVIHHPQNRGYGAALITGFMNARKDFIFYTDGDGQYDVREVHNLLLALRPDIDLVNGYKIRRADPWYRVWIGEAYRRGMRFLFNLEVRDVDCDFRLFRRSMLETISLESHSGVICVEMMRRFQLAGCRVVEIPVSHWPRRHGSSQFFSFRHLVRVFGGLFKIWWKLVLLKHLVIGAVVAKPAGTEEYPRAGTE
jgi:glycosyltransferase involved in cell wall biosynthesis